MSASLGGLIRDYRLQKNLSQQEVAYALGWKEPSRLSRIEQGHIEKPTRQLMDRIISILNLDRKERGNLLLAGNYVPTDDEINLIRKELYSTINDWDYPVTVYDFTDRIIMENETCKKIYYETNQQAENIEKNLPNIIELSFDDSYSQNEFTKQENSTKLEESLLNILIQYKNKQKERSREDFYIKMISKLVKNDLFRKLWQEINTLDPKTEEKKLTIANYVKDFLVVPARQTDKTLLFNLFMVPAMNDPRFEVEFHNPANLETYHFFEESK